LKTYKIRKIKNIIFKTSVILLSILTILPLFFILSYVVKQGISSINWNFFTELPAPVGEEGGGISNAIVGTLMIIILTFIFSVPIGVTTGVFLAENRKSKLTFWVRICVEILQGIPSIVIGIIGYMWIVKPLNGLFSGFAASLALAIMMLPTVIKSTEETVKLVPSSLKEASISLGVPYYKTILKVVLPSSMSGIVSGILIGIGRISGETAPLLFTAFGTQFMNINIFKPINALPLLIYRYATSPYPEWHRIAWGASLLLIIFVLIFNLIANGVVKKWKIQF